MIHPKNKAERRSLALKKKAKLDHERDESVQRRLAEEILEQKEALDVLRRKIPEEEG